MNIPIMLKVPETKSYHAHFVPLSAVMFIVNGENNTIIGNARYGTEWYDELESTTG